VNGLAVISYGDVSFGGPSRITASVGVGRQGIVDIEREASMSGPTHTKGVMIIGGFLSRLFAYNKPLGLTAKLAFEQSYSGVDGDSASSTELYAILSELSGLPLKQNIAVTGSVNQNGDIQAIGGANEKIEGFFEVCQIGGLTGNQGVMIPESNAQNLMLKEEVVEAVKSGKFHIYTVKTVDEGIELLTGVKAGVQLPDGSFEENTVYQRVDKRLQEMAEILKQYPGYA
jgi:predicted ATP-dependent protease